MKEVRYLLFETDTAGCERPMFRWPLVDWEAEDWVIYYRRRYPERGLRTVPWVGDGEWVDKKENEALEV
jgi:hypothetical protein